MVWLFSELDSVVLHTNVVIAHRQELDTVGHSGGFDLTATVIIMKRVTG